MAINPKIAKAKQLRESTMSAYLQRPNSPLSRRQQIEQEILATPQPSVSGSKMALGTAQEQEQGYMPKSDFDAAIHNILWNRMSQKYTGNTQEAIKNLQTQQGLEGFQQGLATTPGFGGLTLDQARRMSSLRETGLGNLTSGYEQALSGQYARMQDLRELAGTMYGEKRAEARELREAKEGQLERAMTEREKKKEAKKPEFTKEDPVTGQIFGFYWNPKTGSYDQKQIGKVSVKKTGGSGKPLVQPITPGEAMRFEEIEEVLFTKGPEGKIGDVIDEIYGFLSDAKKADLIDRFYEWQAQQPVATSGDEEGTTEEISKATIPVGIPRIGSMGGYKITPSEPSEPSPYQKSWSTRRSLWNIR